MLQGVMQAVSFSYRFSLSALISTVLALGGGPVSGPRRLFRRDNKSGAGAIIPTPLEATHTPLIFPLIIARKTVIMDFGRSNFCCVGRYLVLHRGVEWWHTPRPAFLLLCLVGSFYNKSE